VRGQAGVASTANAATQAFPATLQELRAMTDPRDETPHASRLTPHSTNGTVLAFDFGSKRIGTAVGETLTGTAHPLSTIHAEDKQRRYAAVAALIDAWKPVLLVVGLPSHLDGSEHELSRLARKFAGELERRFALPVEFVDERLSSVAADSSLGESGVAARDRKAFVDAVAAQTILQDFLDRLGRRQ
jgi:putative holliday junction resolvase